MGNIQKISTKNDLTFLVRIHKNENGVIYGEAIRLTRIGNNIDQLKSDNIFSMSTNIPVLKNENITEQVDASDSEIEFFDLIENKSNKEEVYTKKKLGKFEFLNIYMNFK